MNSSALRRYVSRSTSSHVTLLARWLWKAAARARPHRRLYQLAHGVHSVSGRHEVDNHRVARHLGAAGTLPAHAPEARRHRRPGRDHARVRRAGRGAPRRLRRCSCAAPCPGDRVRARVTRRKKGYARRGRWRSSPRRRTASRPSASTARTAAAVSGRHSPYAAQLEFKQRQVVESLEHIGHLDGLRARTHPRRWTHPWRYRNKMEFSFGEDDDGGFVLGLHKRGSWREIVDLVDCHARLRAHEPGAAAVADACRDLGLRPFGRADHEGLLRHLVVREGPSSGDLLLNLFVAARFPEEAVAGASGSRPPPAAPRSPSPSTTRRPTPPSGDGPHMLLGPPYLRERLAGVDLRVPATAFLQTNSAMCEELYETALRFAAPDPTRPAVDLYCGIGSLSLPLARLASHVEAVEIQPEAIAAARENAAAERHRQRRLPRRATCGLCSGSRRTRSWTPAAPTTPTGRPSWSSTRRAPAWPARPCSALRRSAPTASCTCRAIPRPWPATAWSSRELGYRTHPRRARRHVPADAPRGDGGAVRARTRSACLSDAGCDLRRAARRQQQVGVHRRGRRRPAAAEPAGPSTTWPRRS